ncbi:hypothetical protein LTR94_027754, partial [Friedmanniomyces endolithicus]
EPARAAGAVFRAGIGGPVRRGTSQPSSVRRESVARRPVPPPADHPHRCRRRRCRGLHRHGRAVLHRQPRPAPSAGRAPGRLQPPAGARLWRHRPVADGGGGPGREPAISPTRSGVHAPVVRRPARLSCAEPDRKPDPAAGRRRADALQPGHSGLWRQTHPLRRGNAAPAAASCARAWRQIAL